MEKGLKLSKKDLQEIEEEKKRNQRQRMEFIDLYAQWLKKKPNAVWSRQQNKLSDFKGLEQELVERKLKQEQAEMKRKGIGYLSEKKALAAHR